MLTTFLGWPLSSNTFLIRFISSWSLQYVRCESLGVDALTTLQKKIVQILQSKVCTFALLYVEQIF